MIINNLQFDPLQAPFNTFVAVINYLLTNNTPPSNDYFLEVIKAVNEFFEKGEQTNRPLNSEGKAGGIVYFKEVEDIIILPDLHARRIFLQSVLSGRFTDGEESLIELLESGKFALVCLGDGVHGEAEHSKRWKSAADEFVKGYTNHKHIDAEIADSFNLMLVIALLQIRYPTRFCFIKGNHENILNENSNGNYSFAKYCYEGEMVLSYFKKFYTVELLAEYAIFERNLPLFVVGNNFMASHAEPAILFDLPRIIDYRDDSALIESLTWTDNFKSPEGTVKSIISNFYESDPDDIIYFGGHRSINSIYNRTGNDNFIQIHNPHKQILVKFKNIVGTKIEPETNIFEYKPVINRQEIPKEEKNTLIDLLKNSISRIIGA